MRAVAITIAVVLVGVILYEHRNRFLGRNS